MWITIRLLFVGFALFWRYVLRDSDEPERKTIDGFEYLMISDKDDDGRISNVTLGKEIPGATHFMLRAESSTDHFFKLLGLCTEIQVSDPLFDQEIYIVCDDYRMDSALKQNKEARDAILAVFRDDATRITYDGQYLIVKYDQSRELKPELIRNMAHLTQQLTPILKSLRGVFRDPYTYKALVLEAAAWGLAGYALGIAVQSFYDDQDLNLNKARLIWLGLASGIVLFGSLFLAITYYLRNTSRGPFLLTETMTLLLFSLPIVSIQSVSDLNHSLDTSSGTIVERVVRDKAAIMHGGSGRRSLPSWRTYHLYFDGELALDELKLPGEMKISAELYHRISKGQAVEVLLGKGFFGIPWYREISPL